MNRPNLPSRPHYWNAMLALTAAFLPICAQSSKQVVDARALSSSVREYLEATGVPGAAVAVTHGDRVLLAEGYGHTPNGDPITSHTPMAVASVSKSFTAFAVMQLVEAGSIDLDQPVRRYLPEFTMADPRVDRITVRQLLNQTSGMSDRTFPAFSRPQPRSLRDAIAGMHSGRLAAMPGSQWEYHNPNYQVAARMVETVSGKPFSEYLRARVFEPLGMRDSRTIDTAADLPVSAGGHLMILGVPLRAPEPRAFGNGSGGVLSSAHDMAAWLIMLHRRGQSADGRQLLSPESIVAMWTPSGASRGYGFGWFRGRSPAGAPLISHSGDLFTSTAQQMLLPDTGHGIAVMVNTGLAYAGARSIAKRIVALLEGRAPDPAATWAYVLTDVSFIALAVGTVVLAVRWIRSFRRWGIQNRGRWTALAGLLLLLAPPLLLATIHRVFGALYRGKDVAWIQVPYLYPTFFAFLLIASFACLAVLIARVAGLAVSSSKSNSTPR